MIRLLFSLALIADIAAADRAAAQTVAPSTQATHDDLSETPPAPMQTVQPLDAMTQARSAAARGDMPEALSRYLRVLAAKPDDVSALIGAGQAALAVGDLNAANGFFARADSLSPNNGAVKAGLGSVFVAQGNARDALRYFKAASTAGIAEAKIAADRGLAYDLRGEPRRAQLDYRLALTAKPGDPMTLRRLALSQAIAGEQGAALATLDPLLRRQDVAAWRTRMFVRALVGDIAGAENDAPLVLPPNQVAALKPYLERLQGLKPADKAAAVFLGRFPQLGQATTTAAASLPRASAPTPKSSAPIPQRTIAAPAPAAPSLPVPTSAPPVVAEAKVDTGTLASAPRSVAPKLTRAEKARQAREERIAAADNAPPPHKLTRAEAAKAAREEKLSDAKEAKAKKAAETKTAAKKNPERYWVQLAGGANKKDLPKAWAKLKGQYGSAVAGRSPMTMHYRYTNRLMIGPFPSKSAAQDWVNDHKGKGITSFPVTTTAGTPVEPVGE